MKNLKMKLYEYELTFILSEKIKTKNLINVLQLFCDNIIAKGGVVLNLQVSTKTPTKYRTFRLKQLKSKANSLYSDIKKKYLFTLYFKANPKLLDEILYNLKIRKLMSKYVCIKVKKNY